MEVAFAPLPWFAFCSQESLHFWGGAGRRGDEGRSGREREEKQEPGQRSEEEAAAEQAHVSGCGSGPVGLRQRQKVSLTYSEGKSVIYCEVLCSFSNLHILYAKIYLYYASVNIYFFCLVVSN